MYKMDRYSQLLEWDKNELVEYILQLENEAVIQVPK